MKFSWSKGQGGGIYAVEFRDRVGKRRRYVVGSNYYTAYHAYWTVHRFVQMVSGGTLSRFLQFLYPRT